MKATFLHGRTRIGERGQIVIPNNIRKALKIRAGDEMVVLCRGDKVVIFPTKKLESYFDVLMRQIKSIRNPSHSSR